MYGWTEQGKIICDLSIAKLMTMSSFVINNQHYSEPKFPPPAEEYAQTASNYLQNAVMHPDYVYGRQQSFTGAFPRSYPEIDSFAYHCPQMNINSPDIASSSNLQNGYSAQNRSPVASTPSPENSTPPDNHSTSQTSTVIYPWMKKVHSTTGRTVISKFINFIIRFI